MKKIAPAKAMVDKRARIIETAGALFVAHGYGAVSMDALADAVPVSKPTLYNHFGDKKTLFLAVMEERCALAFQTFEDTLQGDGDPRTVLSRFGKAFVDFILADKSVRLYRLLIAEAPSFPELASFFYGAGPGPVTGRLAAYLSRMAADGTLAVRDPERSAALLVAMLRGDHWKKALLGIAGPAEDAERETNLAYAIEIFLAAHRNGQ